ncbi:MAG: hypothetical protein KDK39_07540 [Leptospiraceae bacterium]|nr:hypothetical protein [Leptospiraceae bacterium]
MNQLALKQKLALQISAPTDKLKMESDQVHRTPAWLARVIATTRPGSGGDFFRPRSV